MRSLQEISGALHLTLFDQPGKDVFFSSLLEPWAKGGVGTVRQGPPAIPALLDLFLNHLFAVDFKLCFSGERRFFHREGDVRTTLFLS